MVTHNPELANRYSTRIISMLDGEVVDDTNPVKEEEKQELINTIRSNVSPQSSKEKKKSESKAAMSAATSFKLSLNNLLTKKRRTLITSFACSIGIIGIAVILSVSNGMQDYVNTAQRQSTSSNYIMINCCSIHNSLEASFQIGRAHV